jgi:hypothetical protein
VLVLFYTPTEFVLSFPFLALFVNFEANALKMALKRKNACYKRILELKKFCNYKRVSIVTLLVIAPKYRFLFI